jgi:hypothetical protein
VLQLGTLVLLHCLGKRVFALQMLEETWRNILLAHSSDIPSLWLILGDCDSIAELVLAQFRRVKVFTSHWLVNTL